MGRLGAPTATSIWKATPRSFSSPDKFRRNESLTLGGGGSGIERTEILNRARSQPRSAATSAAVAEADSVVGSGAGGGAAGGADGRGAPSPEVQERLRDFQRLNLQSEVSRLLIALLLASDTPFRWIGTAQAPEGSADALEVKTPDGVATRVFIDTITHMPLMLTWTGLPHVDSAAGAARAVERKALVISRSPPEGRAAGDQPPAAAVQTSRKDDADEGRRVPGDARNAPLGIQGGQRYPASASDHPGCERRDERRVDDQELQDQSEPEGEHVHQMTRILLPNLTRAVVGLIALLMASPLAAQNANNQTQLRVVVVDETGAGIPQATIVVTPVNGEAVTFTTDERGLVSPTLAVGTVQLHVEFPGFEPFESQLTLRRGAVNQTVTLKIAGVQEEVVVNETNATDDRRGNSFTTTPSRPRSKNCLDDPEELAEVLTQMAGAAGAVFQVNGFRGGRLPSRDEIRQIRSAPILSLPTITMPVARRSRSSPGRTSSSGTATPA